MATSESDKSYSAYGFGWQDDGRLAFLEAVEAEEEVDDDEEEDDEPPPGVLEMMPLEDLNANAVAPSGGADVSGIRLCSLPGLAQYLIRIAFWDRVMLQTHILKKKVRLRRSHRHQTTIGKRLLAKSSKKGKQRLLLLGLRLRRNSRLARKRTKRSLKSSDMQRPSVSLAQLPRLARRRVSALHAQLRVFGIPLLLMFEGSY